VEPEEVWGRLAVSAKYNWPKLLEEWVNCNDTTKEFASKHAIPYYTLIDRMKKDAWSKARDANRMTAEGVVRDLEAKIESGKINLTEFRRSQAWRNYITLVAMRDNPRVRPSDRTRVAEKLAEWDGVPRLEEDKSGDKARPLTDDELVRLMHTAEALLELRGADGGLPTPSAAPASP